MDPLKRKNLEERLFEEVQTMLIEGDRPYLLGLSRTALLEALETELQFLGLYAHSDKETPAAIHTILEQHLDQWRTYYIEQKKDAISSEQQPTPATRVQMTASPLVQITTSSASGIPMTEVTRYIGFMPPMERLRIQVSPIAAQD